MSELKEFRDFFRQKYAHLGLPDTDEGLAIAARLWESEEQQREVAGPENWAKVNALLDAKETELDLSEVIKRKTRGEFAAGNGANQSEKYDAKIYLPILDEYLDAGLSADLAYLETVQRYAAEHDAGVDLQKMTAAIKKKDQRRKKQQK